MVIGIYRRHLNGEALLLGNFDRLNSFLNTLWLQVQGWKLGNFGGWDETTFMGRNLYALPFTYPNPFNYFVALFPDSSFYLVAGLVTIALHILAGWCAYWFIHDVCRDRLAAFCGAAIYQFSALTVLRASQNDMNIAIWIDVPLMLLVLRRLSTHQTSVRFLALSAVLTHLLVFCFLQEVAYVILLAGFYALTLSWKRRSWLPLLTLTAAGVVGLTAAFPRIYGIAQEMKLLQRMPANWFDLHNFASIYTFQGFKTFDVWRWFHDGLFGRFSSEVFALKNGLNITEGMLLFSGMLTPFLIIGGLLRWNGRWGGLFRQATAEVRLFYALIAISMGVVASMSVYRVIWELFLRVDFFHTRFLIVALLPQSTLVALIISQMRRTNDPTNLLTEQVSGAASPRSIKNSQLHAKENSETFKPTTLLAGLFHISFQLLAKQHLHKLLGVALGISACAAVYSLSGRPDEAIPVLLTDSWKDFWHYPINGFAALSHANSGPFHKVGTPIAAMNAAILNRITLTAVIALLAVCLFNWSRSRRYVGPGLAFFLAGFLITDVWSYANLQCNGEHVSGPIPYYNHNSYWPKRDTFLPPKAEVAASIKAQLEADDYRVALLSNSELQFTGQHIGPTWGLRLVEGYSSGYPARLGMLPWPNWAVMLRILTFTGHQPTEMPWRMLGFTNVKRAILITPQLYCSGMASEANASVEFLVNPARVTPRFFIPEQVNSVTSAQAARDAFFPPNDPDPGPILDPVAITMVETGTPLPEFSQAGDVDAKFNGDKIVLRVTPNDKPRLVVLNELYHPDWHAYVGSKETTIFPANVVMRGVLIPPGATEVVLSFEPFGRPRNLMISFGVALLLVLAMIMRRRIIAWTRK